MVRLNLPALRHKSKSRSELGAVSKIEGIEPAFYAISRYEVIDDYFRSFLHQEVNEIWTHPGMTDKDFSL
jgi:hypothetical protein